MLWFIDVLHAPIDLLGFLGENLINFTKRLKECALGLLKDTVSAVHDGSRFHVDIVQQFKRLIDDCDKTGSVDGHRRES